MDECVRVKLVNLMIIIPTNDVFTLVLLCIVEHTHTKEKFLPLRTDSDIENNQRKVTIVLFANTLSRSFVFSMPNGKLPIVSKSRSLSFRCLIQL